MHEVGPVSHMPGGQPGSTARDHMTAVHLKVSWHGFAVDVACIEPVSLPMPQLALTLSAYTLCPCLTACARHRSGVIAVVRFSNESFDETLAALTQPLNSRSNVPSSYREFSLAPPQRRRLSPVSK